MDATFDRMQAAYDAMEPPDEEEMRPALYDDSYTGPRWRYGLEHRPLTAYFNSDLPDPILFSDRPHPRFHNHGTAEWPRRLTADEARHHSLVYLGKTDGVV